MPALRWLTAALLALLRLASPTWAAEPTPSWQPGQAFRDCPTCPEMVVIPAGEFDMGKGDKEQAYRERSVPLHRETIPLPFAISKFEVTVVEFARFMRESGHKADPQCHLVDMGVDYDDPYTWNKPGFELYSPEFWQQPNHPVVCVSHDDGAAFAEWLSKRTGHSYRLPSEAEWEYAYRAGTTGTYYWGEEPGHVHANYGGPEDAKTITSPVGRFPPNPFGLHDMAGNAAEWVDQCHFEGYPCMYWVVRGGGWYSGEGDLQAHRREWRGDPVFAPTAYNDIGFRVVRDLFPVERPKAEKPAELRAARPLDRDTAAEEIARQDSDVRVTKAYELLMIRSPGDVKARLEPAHKAWTGYRDAECAYQTRSSAAVCATEMNLARAVVLEDALRVRLANPLLREFGQDDVKRGTLGHLSQFAGTYRYDAVLEEPAVAQALESLTGKEGLELIRSNIEVRGPIELDGSYLILRGNRPLVETWEEAMVHISLRDGTVRAAILHEEKTTIYARDTEYSRIPARLLNFVSWVSLPEASRQFAPSQEAPPEGVTWVK